MGRAPISGGGIPYFSLDVHLDTNMRLIEAEFGLKGFAIVVKLWQFIYGQGYYCEWTNDVELLFSSSELKLAPGDNSVSEIVKACIKRGIFDKRLYETYGILTSRGIQKRYFKVTGRRQEVEVNSEYLLVNPADNAVDVSNKAINVNNKAINVNNNPPKVKESKVKESKVNVCVNKNKGLQEKSTHAFGKYNNVILSETEYRIFMNHYCQYGAAVIDELSTKIMLEKEKYNGSHAIWLEIFAKHYTPPKKTKQDSCSPPSFDIELAMQRSRELDPEETKKVKK